MADTSQNSNPDKPKKHRTVGHTPRPDTMDNKPDEQQHTAEAYISTGEKKKRWETANTIAVIAIFVNALMLLATYKLFREATIQTKATTKSADAAKISADAAKQSADLQKQSLDSQITAKKQSDIADARREQREIDLIDVQKRNFENNDRNNKKLLEETKKYDKIRQTNTERGQKVLDSNLKVSTSLLTINKKIIDLENTPLIQLEDMKLDTFTKKKLYITGKILNIGKQPAKILSSKMKMLIGKYFDNNFQTDMMNGIGQVGNYVTNFVYAPLLLEADSAISEEDYNNVISDKAYLYYVVEYVYKSNLSDTEYIFRGAFKIYLKPSVAFVWVYNETSTK